MRRSYRYRSIAVIVLVTVMVSALAGAFDQMELGKAWGRTEGRATGTGGGIINGNGVMVVDAREPTNDSLFELSGYIPTSYLRTDVFTEYGEDGWSGSWNYDDYYGQQLDEVLTRADGGMVYIVEVVPISTVGGQLAVTQYTYMLSTEEEMVVNYCSEAQTFSSDEELEGGYTMFLLNPYLYDNDISSQTLDADQMYLQVPADLREKLTALATMITEGETTPLGKMTALQSYLRTHYQYSYDYKRAPTGTDPVEWFLFSSNTGVCTHFNSALVLMARCLDIPTRMCSGYFIASGTSFQVVNTGMAHAYAEAMLGEDRWIIFDSTPSSPVQEIQHRYTYDGSEKITGHTYPAGRSVALLDGNGALVELNVSDASGYYVLNCPGPGQYSVRTFVNESEVASPGYIQSLYVDEGTWQSWDFNIQAQEPPTGSTPTKTSITSVGGAGGTTGAWDASFDRDGSITVAGTVTSDLGPRDGTTVQIFLVGGTYSGSPVLIGEARSTAEGTFTAECMCPWALPQGSYQLVARALRDDVYSASEDALTVMVTEPTYISVTGGDQFFADTGATYYISVLERSTGVSLTNADVTIDLPGYGSVNTGAEGYVVVSIPAGDPGNHTFSVSYAGVSEHSSSAATKTVEGLTVQVDLITNQLVRGENSSIIGQVHAGSLVRYTTVTVNVTDGNGALVYTGVAECDLGNGVFSLVYSVPEWMELGTYREIVTSSDGEMVQAMITLACRPELTASAEGGKVTARLVDDRDEPMAGEPLVLTTDQGELTASTDENGEAVFVPGDQTNLTVSYVGSSLYLPAEQVIAFDPPISNLIVLALAAVAAAIVLLAAAIGWRSSRKGGEGLDGTPARTERYRITSPAIADGMPLVWGEGEDVVITLEGGSGNLRLIVDGEARRARSGETIALALPKGEHTLEVRGLLGRTVAKARVVDYREEVARVFLKTSGESTQDNGLRSPSAREFLGAVKAKGSLEDPDALVDIFEQAEYSAHEIGRSEYERAYLSSRRVSR